MKNTNFYPEMNETAPKSAEIVAEYLYKRIKLTVLNGAKLTESRSLTFQGVTKKGFPYYYATEAGLEKIKKSFNVSFSLLLD